MKRGLLVMALVLVAIGLAVRPLWRERSANEARVNLKHFYRAQEERARLHLRYSSHFEELGFFPEPHNRYLYLISRGCSLAGPLGNLVREPHCGLAPAPEPQGTDQFALISKIPTTLFSQAGVQCDYEETDAGCVSTMIAAANLDDDPAIDVWSICTAERIIDERTIPAGTPFRHVNDETQ
ncbi:MAG: hypothetical protein QM817_26605 [Archangium sp.]